MVPLFINQKVYLIIKTNHDDVILNNYLILKATMAGSSPKQLYVSDSSSYSGISFITEEYE